jgi:hypothetical protein
VIRNVCIHVQNEQPLLCDLFELPSSDDAGLVCTNVRSMDGKRPVFIDQIGSTFFFPYHVVRFLEIPEQAMAAYRASGGRAPGVGANRPAIAVGTDPGPVDGFDGLDGAEFGDASLVPIVVGAGEAEAGDVDVELEIDEDFLQRVRDI